MNPTAPTDVDLRASQEPPSNPSDDTEDSEILRTPYRSYVIAAIGDSITYGKGASRSGNSYPGVLKSKLRAAGYSVNVYNKGIPGATTKSLTSDFGRMIRGMDIALIMAGTNDIIGSNGCISPANCPAADNIRSMVNTAIQMGVVPVLAMVTPKNPADVYAFLNPKVELLNTQLSNLAQSYDISIVDTYNAILNNGGAQLYCDKHHFNDAGYRVIADAWYQVLVSSVLYTRP
jgi:lysophospholipase L1-like esterase